MHEVDLAPRTTSELAGVLSSDERDRLAGALGALGGCLEGRRLWHVNSTESGGGVAEMLSALLPYARGGGIDVHWLVLDCDGDFFEITKRIHNRLHEQEGDGGLLGEAERSRYDQALRPELAELLEFVVPGDVAILHDPQTAGLIGALVSRGAHVAWRCHIGADSPGALARDAWRFLTPDVELADALVFSRASHIWETLRRDRAVVIPPCIDVLSAKNQPLGDGEVHAILGASGILAGGAEGVTVSIERSGGEPLLVQRKVSLDQDAPLPAEGRWVVQISRWDQLKDPCGVIAGFASAGPAGEDVHLVLAGPALDGVGDDPDGASVLRAARELWSALPSATRGRVHLATIPMEDPEENAVIVNALQRRADVVVQKSLAEGFGLTVAEAMWKARPVLASRVGGIQDQIVDGESGALLDDPTDLGSFGKALVGMLEYPDRLADLGAAASRRVRGNYLAPHHYENEARLVERLVQRH